MKVQHISGVKMDGLIKKRKKRFKFNVDNAFNLVK